MRLRRRKKLQCSQVPKSFVSLRISDNGTFRAQKVSVIKKSFSNFFCVLHFHSIESLPGSSQQWGAAASAGQPFRNKHRPLNSPNVTNIITIVIVIINLLESR